MKPKAPKGKKAAPSGSAKPPQSAPADAKAKGWKPAFPGAKPPFKQPAAKGAAKKGGGK